MENSVVVSEEAMEMASVQKIEETVKGILKEADLDHMTEFKLRIAVSDKLGLDLSGTNHKKLVRDVMEAFLLSIPEDTTARGEAPVPETVAPAKKQTAEAEIFICKLTEKRNAKVEKFKGKTFLSIGETNPEYKRPFRGICMSASQWSIVKNNFSAIEEAIEQFQSKSISESTQNGDTSEALNNNTQGFSFLETSRFDGTGYVCWASQMELFLKQLKLAYVLYERCPGTSSSQGPETGHGELTRPDTAEKDWLRDDYLCHNHLLNSLADHLYRQYLKRFKHAKELWDELKWVYQCEESNSKRSQVRKYIEFAMVEERAILEQVQAINRIADSIVSAGMFLDETFHVSTIISKFPSSWRGFCTRLMEEEFLPVWKLMERVKAEEEFRRNGTQGVTYRPAAGSSHMERRPSLGTMEGGSQSRGWKRKEPERDGRVIISCDNCGRKGHLAKNCWGKTAEERASAKPNRITSSVPPAPLVASETPSTTTIDKEK